MDQNHGLAMIGKAISDPMRISILERTFAGEQNVESIAESVKSSHAAVSHHLRVLLVAGMVCCRKEGKYVYYISTEKGKHILKSIKECIDL